MYRQFKKSFNLERMGLPRSTHNWYVYYSGPTYTNKSHQPTRRYNRQGRSLTKRQASILHNPIHSMLRITVNRPQSLNNQRPATRRSIHLSRRRSSNPRFNSLSSKYIHHQTQQHRRPTRIIRRRIRRKFNIRHQASRQVRQANTPKTSPIIVTLQLNILPRS